MQANLQHDYTVEQIRVDSPWFAQVLDLRAAAYGRDEAREQEAIDAYSQHFVAQQDGLVLGALRITCRTYGPLESERFYPTWLLDAFGERMGSASRMCVRPELSGTTKIPFDLTRAAWAVALRLGVRIDVSKARIKAIPFYLKMGYCFVRDTVFDFERWNARCALIAHPADAAHASPLADLFDGIDAPCDLNNSPYRDKFTRSYKDFKEACHASSSGHCGASQGDLSARLAAAGAPRRHDPAGLRPLLVLPASSDQRSAATFSGGGGASLALGATQAA